MCVCVRARACVRARVCVSINEYYIPYLSNTSNYHFGCYYLNARHERLTKRVILL